MAIVWSLASISCMFTRNYGQLLAARRMVGLGEAGYGSVGAALIASYFPLRMRGADGSLLRLCLGRLGSGRDARWHHRREMGLAGSLRRGRLPGLILAFFISTCATIERSSSRRSSTGRPARPVAPPSSSCAHCVRAPTMLWVCLGGAAQLIVVSAVWAWLPSFLNRVHGFAPDQAAIKAALVVLCGAAGSVIWGCGSRSRRR